MWLTKIYPSNAFKLKNKCRLTIGSTFIYRGDYCTVSRMFFGCFQYIIQENQAIRYMGYEDYLTTPSAAGRQLNKW